MPATSTNQATKLLSDRLTADGFPKIDPALLFQILTALIGALTGCKPTPAAGYDYLAWKPARRWWLDWLPWVKSAEERLYDYREQVNGLIARLWAFDTQDVRSRFIAGLWQAVDAGDLTPDLMAGLYADAKGR